MNRTGFVSFSAADFFFHIKSLLLTGDVIPEKQATTSIKMDDFQGVGTKMILICGNISANIL